MSRARARVESELGLSLDASEAAALERVLDTRHGEGIVELAGALLVHETWFFRDPGVFEELARIAVTLPRPMRLLSAPCASGEEAYSMAIALLDAGVPPSAFEIVGVDVSPRVLEIASAAQYRTRSLRSTHRAWEREHLVSSGDGWTVAPAVRERVRFRCANLVSPDALLDEGPFDVVFCRNMLVYLTSSAREVVGRTLGRLLRAGGALFLGPAEDLRESGFVRQGPAETFRFGREGARTTSAPDSASRSTETRLVVTPVARRAPAPPPTNAAKSSPLEEARALADRGDLEGAHLACTALLAASGHDAEVYALLGTIERGRGKPEAAFRAFQRALYLDPSHPVALISMALHWQEHGEIERAKALFARAAREGGRR